MIFVTSTSAQSFLSTDSNADGWDDSWAATYPNVDRSNPLADLNGDGLPVYLEMAMGLDPNLDRDGEAAPEPGEELRRLRKKIEKIHANYLRTRLNIHIGLTDDAGRPISAERYLELRQAKVEAHTERLRLEHQHQQRKVEAWLRANPSRDRLGRRPYRIDEIGRPLWRSSLSWAQACDSLAFELWPGTTGSTAIQLDATGAGTTLSLWDSGGADSTHEQLSAVNINNVDGLGPSDHATAVACILCGQGDPAETSPGDLFLTSLQPEAARGMSYGAGLRSRDAGSDLLAMNQDSLNTNVDLRISVHPYAIDCGWERTQPAASIEWEWFGNPAVNQDEDWKFGAYLTSTKEIDRICFDDPDSLMLPVWAAGNDSANISDVALEGSPIANDSVPERDGYTPDLSVGENITHSVNQSVVTRYRPEDGADATFGGLSDTIRPEACAKNVLTVGALAGSTRFSLGPTDDGRIKPDVLSTGGGIDSDPSQPNPFFNIETAFSTEIVGGTLIHRYGPILGTSFAAPVVAGGLNLSLDLWQQRRGISPQQAPWGSTLKALAIAGTNAPSPSLSDGWGEFDAHNTAVIVHRDTEDEDLPGALDPLTVRRMFRNIKQLSVPGESGKSVSFFVERRPEDTSFWLNNTLSSFGAQVEVTICWTDPPSPTVQSDVAGGPSPLDIQDKRLVNDIDLRVIAPDGEELRPFKTQWNSVVGEWEVTTGDNERDNVEKVIAMGKGYGVYEIRISHKGTTDPAVDDLKDGLPQNVSVVVAGASATAMPGLGDVAICQTTVAGGMCIEWESDVIGSLVAIESSTDLEIWTEVT